MIGTFAWSFGWSLIAPPRTADPFFLVLAPYWSPRSAGWSDYLWFLAVTCAISAFLIVLAIARIRAVCTREDGEEAVASAGGGSKSNDLEAAVTHDSVAQPVARSQPGACGVNGIEVVRRAGLSR